MRPISELLPAHALVSEHEKRTTVLKFLSARLRLPPITHFPGNHPVALTAAMLPDMKPEQFVASFKADGHRVLLVVFEYAPGCVVSVLLDRQLDIYRYPLTLPADRVPAVLDAELTGTTLWLFDNLLLYDGKTKYPQRVESLEAFARDVDGVQPKPVVDARRAADCFFQHQETEAVDGVVFTEVRPMTNRDYSRRTPSLRKWKPVHTVDLFVGADRQLLWNLGDQMEPVPFTYTVKWKGCDEEGPAEFEATYGRNGLRLVYVRPRQHTNHKSTVESSLACAQEALDIVSVCAVLESMVE